MKALENRLVFDLDNTISLWNENRDYINFVPVSEMIEKINLLYDSGYYIIINTARGMNSTDENHKKIHKEIKPPIKEWLKKHSVKYHELVMCKPFAYYYIDDRNLSISEFLTKEFK